MEEMDSKFGNNLPYLQNLIKRDHKLYEHEFDQQLRHYESMLEIFKNQPYVDNDAFVEQFGFIAQTISCYPSKALKFAEQLFELLKATHQQLKSKVRDKIVFNLCLLHKKEQVTATFLLECLFFLLKNSKTALFRHSICVRILSMLKTENRKCKNEKVNRKTLSILFALVSSKDAAENGVGLSAVNLCKELWSRGRMMGDTKLIEIMRHSCLVGRNKMLLSSYQFFLGDEIERVRNDEEKECKNDTVNLDFVKVRHQQEVNKRKKSHLRLLKRVKRSSKKKLQASFNSNFTALQLIHDPQGFTEQLFQKHLVDIKTKLPASKRLIAIQLISRLIAIHKLILLSFYDYLKKFLNLKQNDITKYLAYFSQAVHSLVPQDYLLQLLKHIANEFVTTGVKPEIIAIGLNSIREICSRQPLAMTRELLSDLIGYSRSRDKGISIASRSLMTLYRQAYPELLEKKFWGKDLSMILKKKQTLKCLGNVKINLDNNSIYQEYHVNKTNLENSDLTPYTSDNLSEVYDMNLHEDSDEDSDLLSMEEKCSRSENKPTEESLSTQIMSNEELTNFREAYKKIEFNHDDIVEPSVIEGPRKKAKQDREARLATVLAGRVDREKFGSKKGKQKHEVPSSTTNKEKRKNKNFIMLLQNRGKGRRSRSLAEAQKILRSKARRQKKRKH